MSFLDERDDPPRRGAPRRPPPGGPGTDRQTVRTRQIVALVAGVLLFILLVVGIRGCLGARQERAFEDYVQEVSSLSTESNQQSEALFELLEGAGEQSSVDVQNNVNGFRIEAENLIERARSTEHPDQFIAAQDSLVEVLEFRGDGLGAIADLLPTALADEGRGAAIAQIAAQMQNFLVSDTIYTQRVVPNLEGPLREEELGGEVGDIPESQFLPDIDWLRPEVVAAAIAGLRGESSTAAAAPGLHGTGLEGVTVQPTEEPLVEGGANQIALTGDVAFEVEVVNQGENDEVDVPVRIAIEGGEPIDLEGDLDSVPEGETATVTIPLEGEPTTGQELEMTVTVEQVPGEETLDNNEVTYAVTFTP